MGAREDIARLLKDAVASMKGDVRGGVAKLESAYAIAQGTGVADDIAVVAEELARAWARRKSSARALYYARKAPSLVPDQRAAWTTLAKTCELIASRQSDRKQRRAQALFRAAALAFKKAASLTTDPEDKRWLLELAGDAARQAKPEST